MSDLKEKLGEINLKEIQKVCQETLISHLEIELKEIDSEGLWGIMPVSAKTRRPFGGLHGGATLALAESLGSLLSYLLIDSKTHDLFGLEINGNHLRPVPVGEKVFAHCIPLHLGKKTHVHEIKVYNQENHLISICRLTVMIVEKKK